MDSSGTTQGSMNPLSRMMARWGNLWVSIFTLLGGLWHIITEWTSVWVPIVITAVVNILVKKFLVFKYITMQTGAMGDRASDRRNQDGC